MGKSNKSKSLQKGLDILIYMSCCSTDVGISDIAQALEFPKSTTYDLISALLVKGFVQQNQNTKRYYLAPLCISLANRALDEVELVDLAYPLIKDLAIKSKENVNLAIAVETKAMIISRIAHSSELKPDIMIGQNVPLYAGAMSKVLLASMDLEKIEYILSKSYKSFNSSMIQDKKPLYEELNKISKQGHAISEEEWIIGSVAVAAPVKDVTGKVVASVSVAGSIFRIDENRRNELLRMTKDTANNISTKLINNRISIP